MRRVTSFAALFALLAVMGNLDAQEKEEAPAPPAVEAWIKYLRGTWECDLGDGRSGKTNYRVAGKTPALVFTARAKDFSILGTIGWRADLKKLVETDFHTQQKGVHGHLTREYKEITERSIRGVGKFWNSAGESGSQALEYRRISDNEMTLSGSASDDGGKEWVVKYKRTKPK